MNTNLTIPIVTAALAGWVGVAVAASPAAAASPVPVPAASAGVDLGAKTSGIGNTDPVAQPSPMRSVDPLAPNRRDAGQVDTPGKTGLGVTDRVPLGSPMDGAGSKTDGIGTAPNAGAGAH